MSSVQMNTALLVDGLGGMYSLEEHLWTDEDGEQEDSSLFPLPELEEEEETEVTLV